MKQREIRLKSDGLNLYGELYIPDSVNKKLPVLCICHGIPAVPYNPAEQGYALLAERFCSEGYITFIFNFRGAGKSEGDLDLRGWARDLTAALDFLAGLNEISAPNICLIGFSGGAAASVYVAAHDRRVSSVICCACPSRFDFLAHKEQITATIQHFRSIGTIRDASFPQSIEDWMAGWAELAPYQWIDKITPHPVFLMHGDKDDVVSVMQAHELYSLAKEPKKLQIIPGAGHRLRIEETAVATILKWLKHLG